jgi:D-alanine-D-alanine ligase
MKRGKIKVGVIFGGKSAEHEVSLQTAQTIINALDKKKYEIVPIGITKSGKWLIQDSARYLLNADNPKLIKLNKSTREVALAGSSGGSLTEASSKSGVRIDVAFPVLHGTYGEDGSVQGFLKVAGIPFVGAGVLGSAVGMDKEIAKRLWRDAGLSIPKFLSFKQGENISYSMVTKELGKTVFVKPANQGSSVGIHKVRTRQEFARAVADAFKYDLKIMVEEAVVGREIECGVIGNDQLLVSLPGEIVARHEFYDYEAKYISANGAEYVVPARLNKRDLKKIRNVAAQAYQALSCEGMARVDMFLTRSGKVLLNEINTIPGPVMFRRLWEASSLPFPKLLDILINLAIERFKKERKLKTSFM